jgi:flagellar hook-basal body complex protein FliE
MIERINRIDSSLIQKNQNNTEKNTNGLNFQNMLKDAINEVNNLQNNANEEVVNYVVGKTTDVHQVIVAAEKASLSLRLTTEVTNKIVEAYKEIMRMQL